MSIVLDIDCWLLFILVQTEASESTYPSFRRAIEILLRFVVFALFGVVAAKFPGLWKPVLTIKISLLKSKLAKKLAQQLRVR